MGRLKKYLTKDEKLAVKKQRAYDYYWNNKEKQDEKSKQRYWSNKNLSSD
jgi:hypothetical protein